MPTEEVLIRPWPWGGSLASFLCRAHISRWCLRSKTWMLCSGPLALSGETGSLVLGLGFSWRCPTGSFQIWKCPLFDSIDGSRVEQKEAFGVSGESGVEMHCYCGTNTSELLDILIISPLGLKTGLLSVVFCLLWFMSRAVTTHVKLPES